MLSLDPFIVSAARSWTVCCSTFILSYEVQWKLLWLFNTRLRCTISLHFDAAG